MPRKPLDAHDKTTSLSIRLTEGQLAILDARRGSLGRAAYLRSLLVEESEPPTAVEGALQQIARHALAVPQQKVDELAARPCVHTWENAGAIFKRCTKCDERVRR